MVPSFTGWLCSGVQIVAHTWLAFHRVMYTATPPAAQMIRQAASYRMRVLRSASHDIASSDPEQAATATDAERLPAPGFRRLLNSGIAA